MKKIYFGIIITIVTFTFLFTIGVFHPKEIYIDNLKIEAPKGMMVSRVTLDYNNNSQNYFSPLFMENNNRYSLSENKNISINFSGSNQFIGVQSISVRIDTEYTIKEILIDFKDNKEYKETSNKKCYIYERDKENIMEIHAFSKARKERIIILSSDKRGANKILKQFCPNN